MRELRRPQPGAREPRGTLSDRLIQLRTGHKRTCEMATSVYKHIIRRGLGLLKGFGWKRWCGRTTGSLKKMASVTWRAGRPITSRSFVLAGEKSRGDGLATWARAGVGSTRVGDSSLSAPRMAAVLWDVLRTSKQWRFKLWCHFITFIIQFGRNWFGMGNL